MRASAYDRAARNLHSFLLAFDDLIALLQPEQPAYSTSRFPRWIPKPGAQAEADAAASSVTRLAGPAAEAFEISGCYFEYKPPGTFQTKTINPAAVWSTMLGDDAMLDPHLLSVVGGQALGMLENWRNEQAQRERGFVGALAWFFTLPSRVREAAGLPKRSAGGALVSGTVALAQAVFACAVGGALAFPIAKLFGWT